MSPQHDGLVDLSGAIQRRRHPGWGWRPRGAIARAAERHLADHEVETGGALCLVADLLDRTHAASGLDVEIGHEELFGEGFGMSQHVPARAEHDAVSVEDELVLAADRVDVGNEGPVVRGALCDHRFALHAFARMVGGAVDVDEQLSAVVRLPRHRA